MSTEDRLGKSRLHQVPTFKRTQQTEFFPTYKNRVECIQKKYNASVLLSVKEAIDIEPKRAYPENRSQKALLPKAKRVEDMARHSRVKVRANNQKSVTKTSHTGTLSHI
jgi:hypothetical protein